MDYRIEIVEPFALVGMMQRMSFAADETPMLWQKFMPRKHELEALMPTELHSVRVYDHPDFFKQLDPHRTFENWAAQRIEEGGNVPQGMQKLEVPGGSYAIFQYKGRPSEAASFLQNIYGEWLAISGCELDDRPHMAVMGEAYKGEHPDSEEEFWVPIRSKF